MKGSRNSNKVEGNETNLRASAVYTCSQCPQRLHDEVDGGYKLTDNDMRHAPTVPFPQPLPFTPFAAPRPYCFPLCSSPRLLQNLCRARLRPSRKRTSHDDSCFTQTFIRPQWSIRSPERGERPIFKSAGAQWPTSWRISELA